MAPPRSERQLAREGHGLAVARPEFARYRRALAVGGVALFYAVALGVPAFGAVSGSLLGDLGGSFHVTFVNYASVIHGIDLFGPLERSLVYGAVTASITVVGGFVAARLLTRVRSRAVRALDFLLENGLIHRLASRNAYLACAHGHALREPVVFLICDRCGEVVEATSDALLKDVAALADRAKFTPHVQVLEIAGRCHLCRDTPEQA